MAEENYEAMLKKLSDFISEFQRIKLVTSVFEFLDQISSYDYGPAHRKEVLKAEFPNVWSFLNDYNDFIIQFDKQLREFHLHHKLTESKKIADKLDKFIARIDSQLDPEKVKVRIRADYTDENLYDDVPFGSMNIKATKPYIWSEFKIEMLDAEYFFDEYFVMLDGLLDVVRKEVELFKNGFPAKDKVLARNEIPMPLDFFRKFSTRLEDYIDSKKWPAFIEICEDYSKEKVRSKIGEFRAINKTGKETYEWNGINRQKAESLALFITALKLRNILDRKGVNFRYAVVFLRFFNMKKRPKWLSTKIDNNPEEAKRVFQFDTLPTINS